MTREEMVEEAVRTVIGSRHRPNARRIARALAQGDTSQFSESSVKCFLDLVRFKYADLKARQKGA